jgi:uncharacterized repeat protein (TIGR03803 family)
MKRCRSAIILAIERTWKRRILKMTATKTAAKKFFTTSGRQWLLIALTISGTASATTYKILHAFTGGPDGGNPQAPLVADAAGNLYGTAPFGGNTASTCNSNSCGTVFELSKNSSGQWTTTVLHSFTGGADGANPAGGLTLDAAGNLYGAAYDGGLNGLGVIFELSPTSTGSWTETVLYTFQPDSLSSFPFGQMIFDAAGNLYGVTFGSRFGSVFELSPSSTGEWKMTVLYAPGGGRDGADTEGGVVFDAAGNLYGVAPLGGDYAGCPHYSSLCGDVFVLHPNSVGSWYERHIFDFNGTGGELPQAGLTTDKSGDLYGTTELGGNLQGCGGSGCGVVYKLSGNTAAGWTETVIHNFGPGTSADQDYLGAYPYAGVTFDSSGNLYGTTYAGGQTNYGTVYKLSPTATGDWQETLLHSFSDGTDGSGPRSGVVLDKSGNIYGTSYYGGGGTGCGATSSSGCGVVYEITP